MKVKTKYYNLLKSGKKTVELRLFDEKRQQIRIGDIIRFTDFDDVTESFEAKVVALHRAADFTALCEKITPQQAGFENTDNLLNILEEFYPQSEQQKYGVLGIEIEVI